MEKIHDVTLDCDFYHCIERDGFMFTSVTAPANILDGIVLRNPETCDCSSPKRSFSKRSLEDHIKLINEYKLEKACVIAENLEFLLQCPTLKYLEIIPPKTAPENYDYSPIYRIPEIRYLEASTEYGLLHAPSHTTIDYSKIKGLKKVIIGEKGHNNINKLNQLEELYMFDSELGNLKDMEFKNTLKHLAINQTGSKTLEGIKEYKNLQRIDLFYERKLNDVSEIGELADNLRFLSVQNCPKITDFSFLEKLENLEFLDLDGRNKIPNLSFLKKLPKLKMFIFSMEIEDGDLTPCLDVPYVRCDKGKKYYNLKNADLPKDKNVEGFEFI